MIVIGSPTGETKATWSPQGPEVHAAPDFGIDAQGAYFTVGTVTAGETAVLILDADGPGLVLAGGG